FGNDIKIRPCKWLSYGLVHRMWLLLPIPHKWFFPQKADVSLFFNYYVPPFAEGKVCSVVYDTVVKDMPETMNDRTRMVLRLTLKKSIKRSDKIITISEFSKSRIIHHFGVSEDKISVVCCGIDRSRYSSERSKEKADECLKRLGIYEKYILYLGTLEPRKNITGLADAYKILSDTLPDCPVLVIAGGKGWLYESIFERVKTMGLEDRVIFTGYVSDEDTPVLMSGAELFCFPSFYEGFGMPPLEAMACGTPAVVSDRTSLPEVVGDAALKADADSPEDIADAMKQILTNEQLKRSLSEKGLARADKFSWENSAKALISFIKE
ncbi:MAG: glycosyltransferase family 4 protein, partial [Oscillospiraceae bacterium]|nr:glycosyltransferase family 4 protein [Oscillospiraceae bacterium]